jgi:glycosyltransferase involved in cell wall biosynthesis
LSGGAAPLVSVIVPAYAAERTIGACVASLAAQQAAPPFEVIVVDSSPDDATEAAVRAAARSGEASLSLDYRRLARRAYPGVARNEGARHARAAKLLFVDADCVAAPDLVARAAAALDAASAASGAIALARPAPASARLRHLLEFKESLPSCPPRRTWMLPSACLAIRRDVLARHGAFPETRASEDWLLDWRMWQAGEDLRFDPRLRVTHATPAGWRALRDYSRLLGFHSGVARSRGGLPGQAMVRRPALAPLVLPVGRTVRAFAWCARHARGELPFLALFWPAYLAMAFVWAWGFRAGVLSAGGARLELACDRAAP